MTDPLLSSPIPVQKDSPLSPNGRFNRLSYLGWYGLMSIIYLMVMMLLLSFTGYFSQVNATQMEYSIFSGLLMPVMFVLWVVSFYFQMVFFIRRLHDLNKTGWLSLLLLVPIIQLFFSLYVLLAPGTPQHNDYGSIRPSSGWEKVLAWLMIILSLLMLFSIGIFVYYFASPALWDAPAQIWQQRTGYF